MGNEAPAADPAPVDGEGDGAADGGDLIMVPLDLVSSAAGDAGFEDPDPEPSPAAGGEGQQSMDDLVVVASPQRQAIAGAMASLSGGELDADGISADIVDTGGELLLWGVPPSPDSVAVVPDLDDFTDPDAWLDALDEMDLPPNLEAAIERLARQAAVAAGDGEESARREFAAQIADVLRSAGVEVLAIKSPRGGFDWLTLSQEDLARERDGEPWAPPGGYEDGLTPRPVGVSLGLGGRVSVWPGRAREDAATGGAREERAPGALSRERQRMPNVAKN